MDRKVKVAPPPAPDFTQDRLQESLEPDVAASPSVDLAEMDRVASAHEQELILELVAWIERARHVCNLARDCAEVDPEVKRCFEDYEVPYNSGGWGAEQSEGLGYVLMHAVSLGRAAAKVA